MAERPASIECRRTQVLQLRGASGDKVDTWLMLSEVVVHIAKAQLKDDIHDTPLPAKGCAAAGGVTTSASAQSSCFVGADRGNVVVAQAASLA